VNPANSESSCYSVQAVLVRRWTRPGGFDGTRANQSLQRIRRIREAPTSSNDIHDVVSMTHLALPDGCCCPCPTRGCRRRSDVDQRVEGGAAGGGQRGCACGGRAAVDRRLEEVRLNLSGSEPTGAAVAAGAGAGTNVYTVRSMTRRAPVNHVLADTASTGTLWHRDAESGGGWGRINIIKSSRAKIVRATPCAWSNGQ